MNLNPWKYVQTTVRGMVTALQLGATVCEDTEASRVTILCAPSTAPIMVSVHMGSATVMRGIKAKPALCLFVRVAVLVEANACDLESALVTILCGQEISVRKLYAVPDAILREAFVILTRHAHA